MSMVQVMAAVLPVAFAIGAIYLTKKSDEFPADKKLTLKEVCYLLLILLAFMGMIVSMLFALPDVSTDSSDDQDNGIYYIPGW